MDGGAAALQRDAAGLRNGALLASSLADLKRIYDARDADSLATRAFRSAWRRICRGEAAGAVADSVTADALAATLLGGIDCSVLCDVGVADCLPVLQRGFDAATQTLARRLRERLRERLTVLDADRLSQASDHQPGFVDRLASQPRAGATSPGKARIILEPSENHADHCLVVAVIGVIMADVFGADPAVVFLAGLSHHLHNAALPDSGFAGEILLGDHLAPVMRGLFARELATLPSPVSAAVAAALAVIPDASTPEGRAFHAADVIDRVLQMQYYERVSGFRASHALDDLNLVHEGPVQAFHKMVLVEAGVL